MMKSLKTPLLTALTFALVGPLFGTIAFSLWGLALGGEEAEPLAGLLGTLWMLPFSYIIGFVPAAVTGLIAGIVRGRLGLLLFIAASAALGFVVSWGFATLTSSGPDLEGGSLNLGVIGAIAGAASAMVSRLLGRRRPKSETGNGFRGDSA